MRYLGCKTKLLTNIEKIINKYDYSGNTFADLFSGTAAVGDYFKDRFKIISNDFMYYSFVLANAKLRNAYIPTFDNFKREYNKDIFEWLNNSLDYESNSNFIYNNYTPKGNRMFFTEETGKRIDAMRLAIEDLFVKKIVDEKEYYYLLASLLDSVSSIANISGTFEAFFKFWDNRTLKRFEISPLEINKTKKVLESNIYNENTHKLIRKISGDIAYIDTPYTVTQYASAYHLLETVAKYDSPKINGVGGKRGKGKNISYFSQKKSAYFAFEDLFRQLNFKYLIISYSNQGIVPIEDLVNLAKQFAKNEIVNVDFIEYSEYKNHRSSKKQNGKKLNEVLISFEKKLEIKKSPLNYSGSKDTIFNKINGCLPMHIGTFIDAMGGAFNVGANIVATDKVIYNEKNKFIYKLIEMNLSNEKKYIVNKVEQLIEEYNLSKSNKINYSKLRTSYNKTHDIFKLFVLHMYSFQNMIRFNTNNFFNTPCGVSGYSDDLKKRIINFMPKTKCFKLMNCDYLEIDYSIFPKDTLFYFDPPYYITNAAYNDGKRGADARWSIDDEENLLNYLLKLNLFGHKFLLSNVIEHKGRKHQLLIDWAFQHNFEIIEVGISGWRYEKKEVLIRNYKEGD